MDDEYLHGVINHLECYVNGNLHTNEGIGFAHPRCLRVSRIS